MASESVRHKPVGIVVDIPGRLLQINWEDGVAAVYDFDILRRACPCVECRPWVHGIGNPGDTPEAVKNATGELKSLQDVQPVGSYAIHFNWADGHTFGIYDWNYLYALYQDLGSPERQTL